MVRIPRILQKFYIYDPNVSDTLGGLQVLSDKDDKGGDKEGTKHVLAVTQQVQYWIDQGLMGEKPVGEISGAAKKMLAQVTRGRSEDNDKPMPRLPKYDKKTQAGSPGHALTQLSKKKKKSRKARPLQEPFTSTNPDNPQAIAKPMDSPPAPGDKRVPPTTPPR
jgi:hypothetical protein